MIFILSNKEREDKDYEEKYRIGKELFEADMLVIVTFILLWNVSTNENSNCWFVYEINRSSKWCVAGL